MKTVIHKYLMPVLNHTEITFLPEGCTILHVDVDPNDKLCLWALIDLAAPLKTVEIMNVGTGIEHPPLDNWTFLGTVVQGPWVNHLFIKGFTND